MKYIATVSLVGLIGFAGSFEYEDELQQEAHYCQMVKEGHWPDYNPDIDCSKAEGQNNGN